MIVLHHLAQSRSRRIVWLLEELGVDYELVHYARDPQTRRSPPSLRKVHALGKSPVLEDEGQSLCESGAIVEYLVERYGAGSDARLAVGSGEPEYARYLQWLHFAEGSAIFPLLLDMFLGMIPGETPLDGAIRDEIATMLDFVEAELGGRDYFAAGRFTAADVMMSFVVEFAESNKLLGERPALRGFIARMRERPAYAKAQQEG